MVARGNVKMPSFASAVRATSEIAGFVACAWCADIDNLECGATASLVLKFAQTSKHFVTKIPLC